MKSLILFVIILSASAFTQTRVIRKEVPQKRFKVEKGLVNSIGALNSGHITTLSSTYITNNGDVMTYDGQCPARLKANPACITKLGNNIKRDKACKCLDYTIINVDGQYRYHYFERIKQRTYRPREVQAGNS